MPDSPRNVLLTKILATVGPACLNADTLSRMIEEGVRVFRVNFSHGDFDDFRSSITLIREASQRTAIPVGILGDLSGPKIRVTEVEGGRFDLVVGDHVEITQRDVTAHRDPATGIVTIATTYPQMVHDAQPGQRLLINDGAIRMLITDTPGSAPGSAPGSIPTSGGDPRLVCRVTEGGTLSNKKGINLPDSTLTAPSLTDWDEECAAWAVENDIDFLALSFVRKAEDVRQLNTLLKKLGRDNRALRSGSRLPIVAKLETPQSINDLDDILDEADAVMVARGDLGVEMDLAQVPVLQKKIIEMAHDHGKPVIVATQMLESMITSFTPTRAEVSDIANAILDGTDAIMLSGETAVGAHPIQAVLMMARTARIAEAYDAEQRKGTTRPPRNLRGSKYRTAALAHGVSTIVNDLDPAYVVMWSELGGGARYLSQNRLRTPVLAVSSNQRALRYMSLLFGVQPHHMPRPSDTDNFLQDIDQLLLDRKWATPGQCIVMVKGDPLGTPGVTNQIRIHYLGDITRLTWHAKG